MKGRILTSLLTVIALTGLQAQNIPAVPRLVVGLTIDQLRTAYIDAFSALYGAPALSGCGKKDGFIGMPNMTLLMWISHQL
mgnify:CR=1 FL=1